MKPGVSRAQTDEQLHVIDRRYQTANPEKVDAKAGMSVVSFHEDLVGPQRPMLRLAGRAAAGQQLEPRVQPVQDLPRR